MKVNTNYLLTLLFTFCCVFPAYAADEKAAATTQVKLSEFETTLLKSQKSEDYLPAFKSFAKTRFFVLVNVDKSAKQGDKVEDFSFVVASNPKEPDVPVIVVSEDIQRLAGIQKEKITAIKMTGAELVASIHPEVSLAIAMHTGIFEMNKKILGVLRDGIKKSIEQETKK